MSAGKDGHFIVKPGDDGILDSANDLSHYNDWIDDVNDDMADLDNHIQGCIDAHS